MDGRQTWVTRYLGLLLLSGLAVAFIPPFLPPGGLTKWLLPVCLFSLMVFLSLLQLRAMRQMRGTLARDQEAWETGRRVLERRVSEGEKVLAQSQREAESRWQESEQEKASLVERLARERERADSSGAALQEIQEVLARLRREVSELADERAQAISQRQSLQKQYFELERTALEIKALHTGKAEAYHQTLAEMHKLGADLKDLHAERESMQAEVARLRREGETLRMDQTNAGLRGEKWKAEAGEWRARAEAAESEMHKLKASTALTEELAARRAEIDRLYQQIEALTQQRDLGMERCKLLDRERTELKDQVPKYTSQIESLNQVIAELQDECRNAHQEPRHDMARHFVWRLNFFKEREVQLSFLNEGVSVDLVSLRTEPGLPCEILKERRLAGGLEGVVRISSPNPLPGEFLLKIVYTIYPQEFTLKVRPSGTPRIERI